ncbi:hypothetical protein SADUNF_Sadunf06G0049400 [Salix dunnii]|uniref:Uncharacterized protein n=1 Tax=Salix dunnii TaxID=1413687 RepID=A0A835K2N0_9ROSI|nr:hypothetical protein SADUNF_Sadunf06G0049400 [Salix dunnii]
MIPGAFVAGSLHLSSDAYGFAAVHVANISLVLCGAMVGNVNVCLVVFLYTPYIIIIHVFSLLFVLLLDLFTIGCGWILFGGLPFDPSNVVGQSLGFFRSCLYAYCKLRRK